MERRITIKITEETESEETEAEERATSPENLFEQADREEQKSHQRVADFWEDAAQRSN